MTFTQELISLVLLFTVTFAVVLPMVCIELGFSWYYVPSRVDANIINHENNLRVQKATHQLASLTSLINPGSKNFIPSKQSSKPDEQLEFSIVIISTTRRGESHYLLQSSVRLIEEVQRENPHSELVVFNVDNEPELNTDAKLLSGLVKVINRVTPLKTDSIFEKEKLDYLGALKIGLQKNAKFILVVQDDALAIMGILWRIRYLLKWKLPLSWLRSGPRKWAYLKLYYPEKWQGYSNSEIPELILIGGLGTLCFTMFRIRVLKQKLRNTHQRGIFGLWCIAGFFYFLLVAHAVGRAHWIEMRKYLPFLYSVSNDFGCCIPAVLFPSQEAQHFAKFLNRTKCGPDYPVDFAFETFTKESGLTGLLASPNLFNHIGFHSSLHSYDKDTREFKLLFQP